MPLSAAALGIVQRPSTRFNGNEILLVKRRDVPIWVLPGGGIDLHETAQEAVLREIDEETSVKADIDRLAAHYSPINSLAAETFVFYCTVKSGQPTSSDEAELSAFFPLDNLPPNFFFIHEQWLKELLQSSALIVRPLKEISYWAFIKYFLFHPWQCIRFAWTRFIN